MEYGLALIDKATEMCGGSAYKLAKAWGVSQTMITLIKKGERKLPIRRVPKLAELAGVDPREAMLRVAEEQAVEGSEERDLLGKALAATVAAMLLIFVSLALVQPSTSYANDMTRSSKSFSLYTSWNVLRRRLRQVIGVALALWHSHFGTRTLALALR